LEKSDRSLLASGAQWLPSALQERVITQTVTRCSAHWRASVVTNSAETQRAQQRI